MHFRSYAGVWLLLQAFLGTVALAQVPFADEKCQCSFLVPADWIVESNPTASIAPLAVSSERARSLPCAFGLRPRVWPPSRGSDDRDVGRFAVEVRVTPQPFEQAAREAFFEQVKTLREEWSAPEALPSLRPDDWLILGRQSSRNPARWIKSDTWFGLYGEADVGYYGRKGGYWGMNTAYRAVISNRRWRAATFLGNNPYVGEEFIAIVQSFKFQSPEQEPPN